MRSNRGRFSGRSRSARAARRPEALRESQAEIVGSMRVHPAGYAFVVREDGGADLFVPAQARASAMDGDRVQLTTRIGRRGEEGRVVKVLERARHKLTGTLRIAGRHLMFDPDDPRVRSSVVLRGGTGGGRDGQVVLTEIVAYPDSTDGPMEAQIVRVLGEPDDLRTEVAKTLALANIEEEFPGSVLREAGARSAKLEEEDRRGVLDLREIPFLTIDPPDARDHDDAVAVRGRRLWVAIADVSHYVQPGSATDREARRRGNSVYLPDRAVPMLPEALSAGACSLLVEDRLAMVARIDFDERGRVTKSKFSRAIVRPRALLPYDDVAAGRTGEFTPQIEEMRVLAASLRAHRAARGSLDFDLPEAKVLLDQDDPQRIRDVIRQRSTSALREAYNLIEEFMLAANEAVARFFADHKLDTLWRVHDQPTEEKLVQFSELAQSLGEPFAARNVTPARLRSYLERLRGRPHERALSMLLLRALAQAQYSTLNVGHFGLAATHYVHFTSPIRRYPDLLVHRLLKRALHLEEGAVPGRSELQKIAAECSLCERRAMEAEREIVDLYRAVHMREHVGDEYDATVIGVAGPGLFVQVEHPFVEGLVRLDQLQEDVFELDEAHLCARGRNTGKVYQLGDVMKVRCETVSIPRRRIEFVPVWGAPSASSAG